MVNQNFLFLVVQCKFYIVVSALSLWPAISLQKSLTQCSHCFSPLQDELWVLYFPDNLSPLCVLKDLNFCFYFSIKKTSILFRVLIKLCCCACVPSMMYSALFCWITSLLTNSVVIHQNIVQHEFLHWILSYNKKPLLNSGIIMQFTLVFL